MNILGIDYGAKKIGLAIADTNSKLASPLKVVRVNNLDEAVDKVEQVVQTEKAALVVIGLFEGETADETKNFRNILSEKGINVSYQDETLSTHEAQEKSIEAGIGRKNRRKMEDAYSAAIILQDYLDRI